MSNSEFIRPNFIFATGIENSYPTITLPDGTTKRVDSMAKADHYRRWQEDFDKVKELGIEFLRYGPPYYKVHCGPGAYDRGFRQRHLPSVAGDGHHAYRRPLPFRCAGLARQLPEPGLPALFRRVRPSLRRPLPLGLPVHAGQRDLRQRPVLRPLWLVERAAYQRGPLPHRDQAPLPGERAGHGGDRKGPPARRVRAERDLGVLAL